MLTGHRRSAPLFLASVTSSEEARTALAAGADIIDCKAPQAGALGALPVAAVAAIVDAVRAEAAVSATIGDLPAEAAVLVPAAEAMASTGVPIVKVGFFANAGARQAIGALKSASLGPARLYAVLMADHDPDFDLIDAMADARFLGVMLDTAEKSHGSLSGIMAPARLAAFVDRARAAGLMAGLAGSLRRGDIAPLTVLRPDILGFRGALCSGGRTGTLEAQLVRAVRDEIDRANEARRTERSVA